MKITYSLRMDDLLAFQKYYLENSPLIRNQRTLGRWILAILSLILGIAMAILIPELNHLVFAVYSLTASVIWYFVFPGIFNRSALKNAKKMISEKENPGLIGEHSLTLSPEGLLEETVYNSHFTRWNGIRDLQETKAHLFFFISALSAHVVPKDQFDDPGIWQEFWRTAQDYSQTIDPPNP